ncbi:MAG: ParB/RepB/Spo0J family partition protein [Faecalibacterium prausnitzii]
MPKSDLNVTLKGLDELLFSTEEQRQEEKREQVQQIPIDELHPFTNHPFKVVDDEAMTRTVESIAQFGVLAPLIARPCPDGDGYEIISGHRRQYAAKLAGLETLPVIVRNMDDDAATILMADSNLQREHISPSERAFAYKMKLDALKNQGARLDLTSRQIVGKLEAADLIGKITDESGRQVQRYVRLTNLIPELLNMVDEKMISFNPAVELSYLSPEQQQEMIKAMDDTQNAPSVSQAKRIKELAQKGQFTSDAVVTIMGEEKKSELDTVTIKNDILRKYFPRSYTPRQMEQKIIQLLDAWQQQKEQAKLKKKKQEAER